VNGKACYFILHHSHFLCEHWYGYIDALPGYNTADYYSSADGHDDRCVDKLPG
jgi:hypothetical protein